MDQYIINLITSIFNSGARLNQIATIVDKVWVKHGEADYVTYRFKKNNKVRISKGGMVEEKKWELESGNGLYISNNGAGEMFRQAVVYKSLLIMKKESRHQEPVLFYDEEVIPDGNIVQYLKNLNRQESQPNLEHKEKIYLTQKGRIFVEYTYNGTMIGGKVYNENNVLVDYDIFQVSNDPIIRTITVNNGKITSYTNW